MKLGIISDCVHYKTATGEVVTENHILLRQLEELSTYFTETIVCCPFADLDDSKVYTAYAKPAVRFIALPDVGGNTLRKKAKLITAFPRWFKAFRTVSNSADVVYQRFPNNLNIPGFFYFLRQGTKVFATYTGTWQSHATEPPTYRLQRWLLRHYFKGPVWVYTDKPSKCPRIHSGFSPSYSIAEWQEEEGQVQQRIARLQQGGMPTCRMITVGTLIGYKNQLCILKACVILKQRNFPFTLCIVGDGPMRQTLVQFVAGHKLEAEVSFAGKQNATAVRTLYRSHDVVVQAPLSEGFGKVPVEGMFHGVIPVINNIAMAKHITNNGAHGYLFNAADPENLADVLMKIPIDIACLPGMIHSSRAFAKTQTLEAWAGEYYETINQYFATA